MASVLISYLLPFLSPAREDAVKDILLRRRGLFLAHQPIQVEYLPEGKAQVVFSLTTTLSGGELDALLSEFRHIREESQ